MVRVTSGPCAKQCQHKLGRFFATPGGAISHWQILAFASAVDSDAASILLSMSSEGLQTVLRSQCHRGRGCSGLLRMRRRSRLHVLHPAQRRHARISSNQKSRTHPHCHIMVPRTRRISFHGCPNSTSYSQDRKVSPRSLKSSRLGM